MHRDYQALIPEEVRIDDPISELEAESSFRLIKSVSAGEFVSEFGEPGLKSAPVSARKRRYVPVVDVSGDLPRVVTQTGEVLFV